MSSSQMPDEREDAWLETGTPKPELTTPVIALRRMTNV